MHVFAYICTFPLDDKTKGTPWKKRNEQIQKTVLPKPSINDLSSVLEGTAL